MKKKIQRLYQKKYLFTYIGSIVCCLLLILNSHINLDYEIFGKVMVGTVIAIINLFMVDTFKLFKKVPINYILAIVVGVIAGLIFNIDASYTARLYTGYSLIIIALTLYKIINDANISFHEYCLKVLVNFIKISIAYGIMQIAVLLTMGLIEILFGVKDIHLYILDLEYILMFAYLLPASIYSVTCLDDKPSVFINGLIKYLLLPIELVVYLLIYIYAGKIVLLNAYPVNEIFAIITTVYIYSFMMWTLLYNFRDDNRYFDKLNKILPYMFIPLLLLQTYSLFLRISDCGITPSRYFGIMILIFEVISLFYAYEKNRNKNHQLILVVSSMLLIGLVLPLVNYEHVSYYNQSRIFKKIYAENTKFKKLSTEDKEKLVSIYYFLNDKPKYLPDYLTEEEIKNIEEYRYGYRQDKYGYRQYKYFNYYYANSKNTISVKGYSSFSKESKHFYSNGNTEMDKNIENYMKQVLEIAREDKDKADKYINDNQYIKIKDGVDYYITSLDIESDDSGKITYANIDGYYLYE